MNTKRIAFWSAFVVVLALIFWGLVVALNKPAASITSGISSPAPVTSADHILGTSTAPVTLIEYGDFQCPACAAYSSMIEKLASDEGNSLRVVFRHFPLSQHQNALITAQAAEAASAQGKFWDMYKLIYDNQTSWENQSDQDIRKTLAGYASSLKLDMTTFASDLDSAATKKVIQDELAEGQSIGIDYTPSLFINGKIITNPSSYAAFKALIDAAAR